MREKGIVSRTITNEIVEVALKRTPACEKCGACRTVGLETVAVHAYNKVGARAGDRVEIEIPTADVVRDAFIVYIIPLICMLIGYFVGGVIFALLFVVVSFLGLMWYDRRAARRLAKVVSFQ